MRLLGNGTYAHNDPRRCGRISDTILIYTKSDEYTWNVQYMPYEQQHIDSNYRYEDERGKFQPITLTGPGVSREIPGCAGVDTARPTAAGLGAFPGELSIGLPETKQNAFRLKSVWNFWTDMATYTGLRVEASHASSSISTKYRACHCKTPGMT